MTTLQEILAHFGGTHESLAKALGVERHAVTMWRGRVPKLRAFQIESLSDGKFKAADILKQRKQKKSNVGNSGAGTAVG